MPSIYETLIGAPPSGEEETRATARQLRGRQELGMLGVITGDPVLGKLGAGMMNQTQKRVEGLQKTRQKAIIEQRERDRQAAIEGNWETQRQHDVDELDELKRWHDMQTETNRLKAAAAARTKQKQPSASSQKVTIGKLTQVDNLNALADIFEDEFGTGRLGAVGGGSLTNVIGKLDIGTQAQKDQAEWWAMYDRMYTLKTRNEMFGSALTSQEKAAWDQANISPNSPPDVIRKGLASLREAARLAKEKQFKNDSALYDPVWVEAMYGSSPQAVAPDVPVSGEQLSVDGIQYEVIPDE